MNNELKFMKYLTALAARCGELLNFHAIANEVEISIDTVKQWFQYYRYQVLFLLEPYSNNILKKVVKTPKVYLHDSGLICYLKRWTTPEVLKNGAKAGSISENFVVSEDMKTYLNSGKVYHLYIIIEIRTKSN